MKPSRTDSIRNMLVKYSLYKRGLQRFAHKNISEIKFRKWLIAFIKLRNRDLIFLPVCEHNFGVYYQEIFTNIYNLHKLPTCPIRFTYQHYKKMLKSIHKNETLRERFYDFAIFLLLLSNTELKVLNFKI
jgi:hypothetical protein